jgi:quercetin dioxygenase-like cupin family protein
MEQMNANPALPAESEGVLSLGEENAFRDNAIVSRSLLQTPQLRVVLFHFDAGQELTEHASPHRALVQILNGGCEFKLGQDWRPLRAGDLVHMPPHLPHAVRATERFSMLLTLAVNSGPANSRIGQAGFDPIGLSADRSINQPATEVHAAANESP